MKQEASVPCSWGAVGPTFLEILLSQVMPSSSLGFLMVLVLFRALTACLDGVTATLQGPKLHKAGTLLQHEQKALWALGVLDLELVGTLCASFCASG